MPGEHFILIKSTKHHLFAQFLIPSFTLVFEKKIDRLGSRCDESRATKALNVKLGVYVPILLLLSAAARLFLSIHASVCPSVPTSRTLSVPNDITLLEYQLSAWDIMEWCTVPRSRSLFKKPCWANFCVFHGTLKFFHHRRGTGMREDIPLQGYQLLARNPVWWCTVTWSRLLYKLTMVGQSLLVPRYIEFFCVSIILVGRRSCWSLNILLAIAVGFDFVGRKWNIQENWFVEMKLCLAGSIKLVNYTISWWSHRLSNNIHNDIIYLDSEGRHKLIITFRIVDLLYYVVSMLPK